jgi:hypothetical protein
MVNQMMQQQHEQQLKQQPGILPIPMGVPFQTPSMSYGQFPAPILPPMPMQRNRFNNNYDSR